MRGQDRLTPTSLLPNKAVTAIGRLLATDRTLLHRDALLAARTPLHVFPLERASMVAGMCALQQTAAVE